MTKTIYFSLIIFTACISYKKYQQQEIISQKIASNGKLTSKTYRQWISHPAGDRLATITQEYDSLNRVVKEYGFNNPYYRKQKYLVERLFRGTHLYILNNYLWEKDDTTGNFSEYDTYLYEEFIYPDSSNRNKSISISLTHTNTDSIEGYFSETFPISPNSWTNESYTFLMRKADIKFDQNRRLILINVKKQ